MMTSILVLSAAVQSSRPSLPRSAVAHGRTPFSAFGARTASPRMIQDTSASTWARDVEETDRLAAVFFYAPWCRACKAALPKMQRIERAYSSRDVAFYQVNFKAETDLCYRLRVFNFPTVLFYLPGVGRVASTELTASRTDDEMSASIERLLRARETYERINAAGAAAAIAPLVTYTKLVGVLQGLAEAVDSRREVESRLAGRRKDAEARIRRMATEAGLTVDISPDPTFEPGLGTLVSQKESTRLGLVLGSRQVCGRRPPRTTSYHLVPPRTTSYHLVPPRTTSQHRPPSPNIDHHLPPPIPTSPHLPHACI